MRTIIRKIKSEWYAGYKIGDNGVVNYIASAPTKNDLIHKLTHEVQLHREGESK